MRAALERGIERFNAGAYREALDEFELPYHEGEQRERDLYLGLIRAAAALYHAERGHAVSSARLAASARELLSRFAPGTGGIDLPRLVDDLGPASRGERGGGARPVIRTPGDSRP